jgi:hypothetical protein
MGSLQTYGGVPRACQRRQIKPDWEENGYLGNAGLYQLFESLAMAAYFAQYGEDRLLHGIFAGKTEGVAVEVGAFDGETGSNTLFFERLGWRCILVEPNPLLAELNRKRRRSQLFECAVGPSEGTVTLVIPTG